MGICKIHENSPVYLEPIEHVYIHRETGIKYTSVTKVLSSIEPHFDSESIAEAIVNQGDNVKQERYKPDPPGRDTKGAGTKAYMGMEWNNTLNHYASCRSLCV